MLQVRPNPFAATVIEGFRSPKQNGHIRDQTIVWLETKNEETAEAVAENLHSILYPHSNTRHRLSLSASKATEVFKSIFEVAFRENQDRIIENAQKISKKQFYPLWKRVCFIQIPLAVSGFFENKIVRIAITVAGIGLSIFSGYQLYEATKYFMAAKAIPFLINNTPTRIIRLFNATLDLLDRIQNNMFKTLVYYWVAREIVLMMPEIPYLTAVARTASIWAVFQFFFFSPETVGWFLFNLSVNTLHFFWEGTENISTFFRDQGERAKGEFLATSKQAAYELWMREAPNAQLA